MRRPARPNPALALAVALVLATGAAPLVGCGSIASDTGAGIGDAGPEATSDDAGDEALQDGDVTDVACTFASEGAACSDFGEVCNQPVSPCCDGKWVCNGGTWHKVTLGCPCAANDAGAGDAQAGDAVDGASGLACGGQSCASDQLCTARPPGIPVDASPPPLYYQCAAIPTACAGTPTCACVTAHPVPGCTVTGCSVNAGGRLQVGCMGA